MMWRYGGWSDEQLLAATRAGQADAYGVFFARHSPTVLEYVRRRTPCAEDACDLMAETFAAALLSVHRGQAESVPEGAAWLIGIARNKLIDSYRRGKVEDATCRELGIYRRPMTRGEIASIDATGAGCGLVAALEALSPHERHAILERIVLERDYDEIARSAQQSEPAIRKRVSRGLDRMRNAMGEKL